jgi:hypothetical protein
MLPFEKNSAQKLLYGKDDTGQNSISNKLNEDTRREHNF